MTNKITDTQNYTDIANAIREKNGETTQYKPSEMAAAIAAIVGGGGDASGYLTKTICHTVTSDFTTVTVKGLKKVYAVMLTGGYHDLFYLDGSETKYFGINNYYSAKNVYTVELNGDNTFKIKGSTGDAKIVVLGTLDNTILNVEEQTITRTSAYQDFTASNTGEIAAIMALSSDNSHSAFYYDVVGDTWYANGSTSYVIQSSGAPYFNIYGGTNKFNAGGGNQTNKLLIFYASGSGANTQSNGVSIDDLVTVINATASDSDITVKNVQEGGSNSYNWKITGAVKGSYYLLKSRRCYQTTVDAIEITGATKLAGCVSYSGRNGLAIVVVQCTSDDGEIIANFKEGGVSPICNKII